MNVLEDDYESYPPHTRIPDEEIQAIYVELTFNGEYRLLPYEEEWRDCGPLINHYGYQLRRRYDVEWTPSWENTSLNPFYCEDSIDLSTPNVIDAVRITDGLPVAIKRTLAWTTEASIAFLFTDEGAVEEPRNHCVPILDTFIEEDSVYIVMPLLRPFNDPPFLAVGEVIDFISQLVEGIEYMHQQNVAHRDITMGNIMMDASELYPEGFHPVRQNLSKNGIAEVVGVMRTHAPVRYYLIDFDSAIAFEKGTPSKDKYAEGKAGRDDEVPEFKINTPYDPFKVDIFQFGNLLKKEFLQKYTGVEFLEPLVREMTRPRPLERPSASTLRVRFNTVRNRLTPGQMRAHLNLKDATDPFRERLLQLGIESLLESDPEDSPEHSSSEAPTTGNSNRSHDSYWSAVPSMESSITSQSSIEQPSKGPLNMFTDMFSRSRSPSRPTSQTPQEAKGSAVPWKPVKLRSPSPPPAHTAPQSIASSNDQQPSEDSLETSSRLKTGRFPWSPSSSPDSVGSPILAVVNQFLQPDTSHTYADVFDNDYARRPTLADDRIGKEQTFASPQYPATSKVITPAAAPTRNRRNTLNAAPAPPPAPAPTKATPETSSRPKLRTGTFNASYGAPIAPAAPAEYGFFGAASNRSAGPAYGKQAQPSNIPMFSSSNNYGWDSQPSNEQGYFDMPQYEEAEAEDTLWASEEALRSLNQPPPAKPMAPRPTEKKEQVSEKKSKTSKSPFSTLSKKSAPSEPVTSTAAPTASTLRAGLGSKSLFAAASANRKSTIAVEDGTPFNTPPKTTVNLPSPSTSPVTAKAKKVKSKKGSISETPKEAPKEKEVVPMKDEDFSLPPMHDDFSTSKVKRRGSGASGTPRPTSPMAMFLGSRPTASNSKKETAAKPPSAKPSSFKPSAFGGWASKAKPSPPAETDFHTDNFSFGASAFSSSGWKNKADESSSMALVRSPATSPNEGGNSDYEMASEPVSTPPTKSGWKTKQSYFPTWEAKPSANSPKEEEDDLAHLYAQMTYPNNAEATPKAPVSFDFSGNVPAFHFNTSATDKEGDDFWSGISKGAKATAAKAEPAKPVEEPSLVFSKSKTTKSKFDATPEPTPAEVKPTVTKGKNKKVTPPAKTITKPTIAVESPQPTPTSESEDPWSYGAATAKADPAPVKAKDTWSSSPPAPVQKASKAQPAAKVNEPWSFKPTPASASKFAPAVTKAVPATKQNSNELFGEWFGNGAGDEEEDEFQEEEDPALSNEVATPEVVDSWFSTTKPKAASKASKSSAASPPIAKGKKGGKVESSPQLEAVQEPAEVPEQSTPDVEESSADVDDWWSPAPSKATVKSKATKGGAAEVPKSRSLPVTEESKPKEEDKDQWSVPTKGKKGKNAKDAEPAKASSATPAASKWPSINFDNEGQELGEDDLAAGLAATLGQEEPVKVEEAPKSPEPEAAVVEEKPAPKATAAKANPKAKKKGKR